MAKTPSRTIGFVELDQETFDFALRDAAASRGMPARDERSAAIRRGELADVFISVDSGRLFFDLHVEHIRLLGRLSPLSRPRRMKS